MSNWKIEEKIKIMYNIVNIYIFYIIMLFNYNK